MKLISTKLHFKKEFFLFLLPIFFVFHGFIENYPLVHVSELIELTAVYIFIISIVAIVCFFIFKSWRKASIFTLLTFSFYFFFGSLHDAAKNIFGNFFITKYIFIIPAVLVLLFILFFFIKRTKRKFDRLGNYANVLFLVLILLDVFKLFTKESKNPDIASTNTKITTCDTCTKPDIYFIVADEYAGKQTLNDLFQFNNNAFESALKAKGFHIIDSSKSNYNYTFFSIASMLQMNYLQGIEGKNSSKKDRNLTYKIINHNLVTNYLGSVGYTFKNYSVFSFNNQPVIANSVFFKTGKDLITSQTFLQRINRDIRFNLISRLNLTSVIEDVKDQWLSSVTKVYEATKKEATQPSEKPRFIYTHLMMPHYPYFFDSNGKPNELHKVLEGNETNKEDYIEYLQYSNIKFLQLIDYILTNSKQPPIIIFVSDHGFRHYSDADDKYNFINFAAVYLPNKNYKDFYNGMSNVNLFRVLLNSQFNQNLKLLKDSTSLLIE